MKCEDERLNLTPNAARRGDLKLRSQTKGPLRRRKTGAFKALAIISAVWLVAYSSCSMSRVLCFKVQDANCSFRLSWATSAIRFRLGISRVNGYRDGFSGLRMPESPSQ